MIRKLMMLFTICALAGLLTAPPACADTIQLALASPNQVAAPGDLVSFTATVTAPSTNAAAVYLNTDSHTEDLGLIVDDLPFLLNFPWAMNPGDSTTAVLFTVQVGGAGTYSGFFDLLGGADTSSFDLLSSSQYSITVSPVSAVPEPTTILLIASGALVLIRSRKLPPRC